MFLLNFTLINLYLMMFNLLPIPPLDGSSVIALLVPDNKMYNYYKIQQYAMPVFMILLIVVPYFFNFNPISLYLNATAGNLAKLIFPLSI